MDIGGIVEVVVMVTAVARVIGVIRSNLFNFKFCGGICFVLVVVVYIVFVVVWL